MPLKPSIGRQRQADFHRFEASPGYTMRLTQREKGRLDPGYSACGIRHAADDHINGKHWHPSKAVTTSAVFRQDRSRGVLGSKPLIPESLIVSLV